MLVLNLISSIVCLFGEVVMQDYWMRFFKFKKDARIILDAPFQTRTLPLFSRALINGYLSIISVLKEDCFCLRNPGWTCTGLPLCETVIFEIPQLIRYKASVVLWPSYCPYQTMSVTLNVKTPGRGRGGTRYILGWGGAARHLIPWPCLRQKSLIFLPYLRQNSDF